MEGTAERPITSPVPLYCAVHFTISVVLCMRPCLVQSNPRRELMSRSVSTAASELHCPPLTTRDERREVAHVGGACN
eukprot:6178949-Pleurochrysis_carterae.AAC.1